MDRGCAHRVAPAVATAASGRGSRSIPLRRTAPNSRGSSVRRGSGGGPTHRAPKRTPMNIQWPGRQTQVESGTAGGTSSRNGGGGGGVQSGGCCAKLDPVIPAATTAARSIVRTRGAMPFIMCPITPLCPFRRRNPSCWSISANGRDASNPSNRSVLEPIPARDRRRLPVPEPAGRRSRPKQRTPGRRETL
jgi:hypothetical protein